MDTPRNEVERRTAGASVEVSAPLERVWRALTEARELVRWFPLEADVDPGPGGRLVFRWGDEAAFDETIDVWQPPSLLRTYPSGEDTASGTEYRLENRGDTTRITAVTAGLPPAESSDDLLDGVERGWAFELHQLRHYLERHPGRDRDVIRIRRPLSGRFDEGEAAVGAAAFLAAFGGRAIRGASRAGRQWVAETDDPRGGLVRVSLEPSRLRPGGRDLSVWLSVWGGRADRLRALRERVRVETDLLERTMEGPA